MEVLNKYMKRATVDINWKTFFGLLGVRVVKGQNISMGTSSQKLWRYPKLQTLQEFILSSLPFLVLHDPSESKTKSRLD